MQQVELHLMESMTSMVIVKVKEKRCEAVQMHCMIHQKAGYGW